ncbi:hypothetical protein [Ponticaulis sp.]|uniref:hypothetical protein n=1 Tax=Ponticaulis sp. TaxID=2020902 RepID=UPI000B766E28|nr:hypothetical protein [Ponticaulis sp.]MAI90862.1 hypothetical protein [Ponticaulis sp.]OUX98836.1 MAG: hypothetical protein CBB65_10495 [Hyphomonadaceae bacterium TMED5]|tara:strand:- start:26414 stop:26599 length:186 start_codon:yes stop_codon:yes gene_type:complete
MSSFTIYVIGFAVIIAGLSYAAAMLGVSTQWIVVAAIVLAGIGLITAVTNTRKKDETEASQ